jgi:hypothetical protein
MRKLWFLRLCTVILSFSSGQALQIEFSCNILQTGFLILYILHDILNNLSSFFYLSPTAEDNKEYTIESLPDGV